MMAALPRTRTLVLAGFVMRVSLMLSGVAQAYPDLRPYAFTGWADTIVITNNPNSTADLQHVYAYHKVCIFVGIGNHGDSNAGSFTVELSDEDLTTHEIKVIGTQTVDSLAANKATNVGWYWSFTTTNKHRLTLKVDAGGSVYEGSAGSLEEGNNTDSRDISVEDDLATKREISGASDNPSSVPLYVNDATRYPIPGCRDCSGGICMATGIADILGYWDRTTYSNGIRYWNLMDHGQAPLRDARPTLPGHTQGDVKGLVQEVGEFYYGTDEYSIPASWTGDVEDWLLAETVRHVPNSLRGLQFKATVFKAPALTEAQLYQKIRTEIDLGRPVLWRCASDHIVPVIGYVNLRTDTFDQAFVHVNSYTKEDHSDGGTRTEYICWDDGFPFATWERHDVVTIEPGGTPSDQEYEPDNNSSSAKEILPDDVYEFRQTRNFHQAGDVDWVKFKATGGQGYLIETKDLGTDCDTLITLYDTNGSTELMSDDNGAGNRGSKIHVAIPAAGYYFVKVTNKNSSIGHRTNYDIQILRASGGTAPTVPTPTFDPPQGSYTGATKVTIDCPGAVVRYTTDNSTPNGTSSQSTGSVLVNKSLTLKAKAWKTGWTPSSVQSASYTITYTLSVSATNGAVERSPSKTAYSYNDVVTLTAKPNSGYSFTGWAGALSGAANPATITMDANKTVTANFAKTYRLTVNAANGKVTLSPNKTEYTQGEAVQLTAAPNTGYEFTGWSGALTGTANPASLLMDGDKTVTAAFTVRYYKLTVNAVNGKVTPTPAKDTYAYGETVTLAAESNLGYVFTGWSGALTGAANPATVTMDADKDVTANFVKTFALTTNAANGKVTRNPDKAVYPQGQTVALTAVPDAGYEFDGWSGALTGSANPASLLMDADKTVTAAFRIKTYALTIIADNGTVTRTPAKSAYPHGETVSLTAEAAPGYVFTGWSGALTGTANPATITMDASKSVTANFARTYTLSVSAANGAVTRSPDAAAYTAGMMVTLMAVPDSGYAFTGWSGALTGESNPATLVMDADKNVTASFARTYTLTIYALHGAVTRNPNKIAYTSGETVTLTAEPSDGYAFVNWSGDLTGTSNPATITMNGDRTVTANFSVAPSYTLTVTAANGNVTRNPNKSSYTSGETVTLTATPNNGYVFTGWSGSLSGTSNPATITMNANKSVTANFAPTYALTVTATNGSVACSPNKSSYTSGETVTLTATPNAGYVFTGWSGSLSGTSNPATITMNANKSVTANFSPAYTLTVSATNGSVTRNPNKSSYTSGEVVTLTATPNSGYVFTGWSGSLSGTSNPATITMNANKSVTANFARTYTLTVSATNGSVTRNPNKSSYTSGEVVTLTATPNSGYVFTGWSGSLSGTSNPATITMNANKSVTANFARTYTLTVSATNGSVTRNPNKSSYTSGEVVTLTATPNSGYMFTGWSGSLSGTSNPATITMNANKSVTASFALSPKVTYPTAGGIEWEVGSTYTITWGSSTFPGASVKIDLYGDGFLLNRVITTGTSNDGSYSWKVPDDQSLGSHFKIRIVSTSNSSMSDWSDNYFTIKGATKPTNPSPKDGGATTYWFPTLSWTGVSGVSEYYVDLGTSTNRETSQYDSGWIQSTSYKCKYILTRGRTYYWTVSYYRNGSLVIGDVWSFTTE